jgi:glyoxylase-like metal-dependent hydrolase (beta-lactamase superfamily II)
MRHLMTASTIACLTLLNGTVAAFGDTEHEHNPANTISVETDHPDSFSRFAPELPALRARAAEINTDFGLHVSEIEPGLFFVTDLIYQSAFLVTAAGVVVFDAPPSFGEGHRAAIEMMAPGVPITHFIMSHAHADHNGGGHSFADVEGLTVIAASANAESLASNPLRGVLTPTETFDESLALVLGDVPIDLQIANYHAEDTDVMIHLPEQRFLMAVDTITPGEAPFMNFGATSNVAAYLEGFDTFLGYDFGHFLSGHVSVLGNRDDVLAAQAYTQDVWDTVYGLMPSFHGTMMEAMHLVEFQHGNLAYRIAMEQIRDECAAGVIDRWDETLSVVDLWADSHCETVLLHAVMH